jgi:glycosyltransferase involved in cell wall biosynthesis
MCYDIVTKGRSHLYDLAVGLQEDSEFNKLRTCWPKFKFNKLNKKRIESHFYLYFIHHFFSKYIDLEDAILKLSCRKCFHGKAAIVDVNLAKYLYRKYEKIYLDHPTNSYFYQVNQWEYEEKLTGIEIPRLQKLKQLYNEEEIINIYNISNKIVVPSLSSFNSFPEEYKSKLEYNPFWIQNISFENIRINFTHQMNIGFIGIICPSKGIHYLIEALNLINFRGVLHLFGSKSNIQYVKLLQAKSQFKIKFYGHLSQDELYNQFKILDLAVMPSVSEGLPLSSLQALSHGIPIIGSEDSSLREIIGTQNIYQTRNIEELAELIEKLIDKQEYVINNDIGKYTMTNYIENWRKIL